MKGRRNPRSVGNDQFAAGVGAAVAAFGSFQEKVQICTFCDFCNQRFSLVVAKEESWLVVFFIATGFVQVVE